MLTYLIILLDDTSVSFCHYDVAGKESHLIDIETLRRGIVWAMKENLNIQFVYPDYHLPEEYRTVIETIDHTKIGPVGCGERLDVIVTEDISGEGDTLSIVGNEADMNESCTYVWRTTLKELNQQVNDVLTALSSIRRLNLVMTGIETWKQEEYDCYKDILNMLVDGVLELFKQGKNPQLNILTDRLSIGHMNNCGAGESSVTLAPDGRFYICPAFYNGQHDDGVNKGLSIETGVLTIPNQQLYRLDYAPICRVCDAFHCRRCVWMNERLTYDVNTPSHQQCVVAHLERNASRRLQQKMLAVGIRMEETKEIPEVDYLDPFELATRWK